MKNKILKTFSKNTTEIVGIDGRFHTVYIVEFDDGSFYVGKHTSDNLKTDSYFCSGKLANRLKDSGVGYERSIMFFCQTSNEAIECETEILSQKKIYDDPNCLNCYPGSPPDSAGTIIVTKGNKFKMVNPKRLQMMLEDGWEQRGVKRIWVNKDGELKFVLQDEISEYLENGWCIGNIKAKDKIFITDGKNFIMIKRNLLPQYISKGWKQQHNVSGRTVLRRGEEIIKVKPEDVEEYKNQGFVNSSTVDGLIYIMKDGAFKRVPENEVQSYISDGWEHGNNTTGTVFITDGTNEHRIYESELHLYPTFSIGRIEKLYFNNGKVERRIRITDIEQITKVISEGFVEGKLIREKKIKIFKDKETKFILPHELDTYINDGWTNIFNKNIHFHPRLKIKP